MIRIIEAANIKLKPGEVVVETGDDKYTLVNCNKTWQGQKLYQAFNNYNICVGSILAKDDKEAADKLGKKAFEESLNIEEVCASNLTEASSVMDKTLTEYISVIEKALKPIVAKAQEICKKVNLTRSVDGESDTCTFSWYGKKGIQLFFAADFRTARLIVDEDYREWENLHAHLAPRIPKPDLPLILKTNQYYALKGYYKESEASFIQKDIGRDLEMIVNSIKKGDVEKAANAAFQKADPSTVNESLAEGFTDWYEELSTINN